MWLSGADEAEGRLMQLVQRDWVGGSPAARSQSAEAGMAVLTQMWEAQSPTSYKRLHSHLDATILEEVGTCCPPPPPPPPRTRKTLCDKASVCELWS